MKSQFPRHAAAACIMVALAWCAIPCAKGTSACGATSAMPSALRNWEAGRIVDERSIAAFGGTSKCFVAEAIDDTTFKRIYGKSYKRDCTVARSQLRLLKVLHRDNEGNIRLGEMICHKDISGDLIDIFKTLYSTGYPIERMMLVDEYNADDETSMAANNTSCFNFRRIAGAKKLSLHSQGKAIDINPLYNPCVKRGKDGGTTVSPKGGKPYANRTKTFKYKISKGDPCYKAFISHGFKWGGAWNSLKDYQHFEKP